MAISQVPISTDSFTHQVKNPAWKHKPTWYMVAGADRSINPDQERMMAKRANAKTVEVNSSHVAYMSHPKEAARLIEEAATSCEEVTASAGEPIDSPQFDSTASRRWSRPLPDAARSRTNIRRS